MLDFVGRVARSSKARDWFEGENFSNLVNLVFNWAQMTQSDVGLSVLSCYSLTG